jgi:Outer membrane protein beta-barrel domain
MKRLLLVVSASFLLAPLARAQSDYPKAEAYVGYSYFSFDTRVNNPFATGGNPFIEQREGLHGVGFSGAFNLNKSLGVVADFSYHKKEIDVFGPNIKFSTFNFLFGPRFTARGKRIEGFAHVLAGGIQRKLEGFDSSVDFALGAGGGVDVKIARNFAIRLVQIDYMPFRDRNPFTGDTQWRQNARVGAGLTFRFH